MSEMTDTEILNWLEREGLESLVRCPQFAPPDKVVAVLWASHWTWHETHKIYTTLREAALAGMEASKRPEPAAVSSPPATKAQITNEFRRQLRGYLADATILVWRMQHSMNETESPEDCGPDLIKAAAELSRIAGVIAGIVSRWELFETREEMLERLKDEESEALMPGGFQ